jgi:dUTP pyrophosphatase
MSIEDYCVYVKFDDGETIGFTLDELEERPVRLKVRYFDPSMLRLELIEGKSDWYDLRAAKGITYEAGEYLLIPLGIAVELPEGHEAHIVPRSSTFKSFGIIQTNSMGIVDESYCGDEDQWFMPAYALRAGVIKQYDRICQFRTMRKMEPLEITEVSKLDNADRGGHGSTGVQ